MAGRLCLVTGGTGGIGFEAARALAAHGERVVIVGRSSVRCESAVDRIERDTGTDRVEWLRADLSVQREVRGLAEDIVRRYDRLDVLVNNAGGIFVGRQLTRDGIERTFALNHLAYFLLTNLVLDLLQQSAPARVINVASVAHKNGTMDLDDLQFERGYRPFKAYNRSKLANLLFTYELARRLKDTGVTVNSLHPGYVRTNIGSNNGPLGALAKWAFDHVIFGRVAIEPREGASTIVYLATSHDVAGVSGYYFVDARKVPSSAQSNDAVLAARLWQASDALTGDPRPLQPALRSQSGVGSPANAHGAE